MSDNNEKSVCSEHERVENDSEDVKFIGVFSTRENANRCVQELKTKPGFNRFADGFYVGDYEIDKIHWAEGFGDGEGP